MSSNLVSKIILDEVQHRSSISPRDVVIDFKAKYGLEISYHHAWSGVEKAKKEIYGDHSSSFDELRWCIDVAKTTNSGSCLELDYDPITRRFKRLFVSFRACIEGFNFCRPLLFLDGTFLKGRYKGNLLSATGKDGNQGLFPLAFGICDSENEENWNWFMNQLSNIVDTGRTLTFISDRNAGLLESISKVFSNSYNAYCLHHLKCNLRDKLSGRSNGFREKIMHKFCECAYAPTVSTFNVCLEELIQEGGSKVMQFIAGLPYEKWSNAYFRGQRYGEMWSNVAESFNSWIREARELPITNLVDTIRIQTMKQMANRREISIKWSGTICPDMESRLHVEIYKITGWVVSLASNEIFEVHSVPSVSVDISRRTCSCFQWQLKGFPCAHAVVAIMKSGKDITAYIEPYFHVKTYQKSYSSIIYPISTVEKHWNSRFNPKNIVILPPISKRQPGRPKKK